MQFALCAKIAGRRERREGTQLGVSGTPTFFINGRNLTGAQPLEAFAKVIDEELTKAGTARPGPQRQ